MSYQQFTLTQMQALLSQKWEGGAFWTNTEATSSLNEGLLMWNALTGFWSTSKTITTTSNTVTYPIDPGIVFGSYVEFNGKTLSQGSLPDMDNGRPGWSGQTTLSGGIVPTTVKVWLPISIDMIEIWPADALGGNTLTVYGVAKTPVMVNGGDYIDIGYEALNSILGYALHIAAFKEGGQRFADTLPLFQAFLTQAAEMNDQLLTSDIYRQMIGVDEGRQMQRTRGVKSDYDQLAGGGSKGAGG